VFFLGRNSYIYWRLLNNLSLSAEDYIKKWRVFKNFKVKKGYYELKTYISFIAIPEVYKGWGEIRWSADKWGS